MAKRNPRYLVSLDGYDLATVPAFTKVEAVKRAKQIYPGRRGTWTAVQVEDDMYGRMKGGAETEARMRLERKRAAAAARTTTGRRRNGTHIHAETVGHLDVAKVHNPSQFTEAYLAENSRRGRGAGLTVQTFLAYTLKGKQKQYISKYASALNRDLKTRSDVIADKSQRGGEAYYRIEARPNPDMDLSAWGHARARDVYSEANNDGFGFAIGDESDDIAIATTNAGWRVLKRYDISLLLAEDSTGNRFLVGGDGSGQGPWVIAVEA